MKRLLAIVAFGVVSIGLAAPVAAAPAAHDVFIEEYDAYEAFAPGEAQPCVPWAGTFHEVRSGQAKLVTISSGPRAGVVHATGVIDGFVEFIPDDGSLPTYSGTYREKLNAVLLDLATDETRVAHFRLRSVLTGSDGSSLTLVLSGKSTLNGQGEVVVDRFRHTCE